MKLTWSHLLPVLLLIVTVALETKASRDAELEANSGRFGIFRKHRRSVSKDDDIEPSGRVVTPNFFNNFVSLKGQAQANTCPPVTTTTKTEPAPIQTITLTTPGAASGTNTYTFPITSNTSARAVSPLSPQIVSDDYEYDDEDDDSDYEFDRNVDNRDDDDDDEDDDDENYLASVKNGQRVFPMRRFERNDDLSISTDQDVDANSFARASRNNQSNYMRRQQRLRRQRMQRRRRLQQRRNRRRRRQQRLRAQRRRNNRRRRVVRRYRRGSRGSRNGPRRFRRRGQNRVINI